MQLAQEDGTEWPEIVSSPPARETDDIIPPAKEAAAAAAANWENSLLAPMDNARGAC